MKQVLVLYASTHGHTAKIASRVRFGRRVAELLPAAATVS
jgi:flavodoxin